MDKRTLTLTPDQAERLRFTLDMVGEARAGGVRFAASPVSPPRIVNGTVWIKPSQFPLSGRLVIDTLTLEIT